MTLPSLINLNNVCKQNDMLKKINDLLQKKQFQSKGLLFVGKSKIFCSYLNKSKLHLNRRKVSS